jgi:glycosyltransferase involved in cell wall biosynthesis
LQLKNKKIIFTVTNDLSYDQRMQRICSSLSNAGYEVELVGRKLLHSKPLRTDFNFKQTRLTCKINKGKLFYMEFNLRLLWYLLRQKTNAICAIDLDTILACGITATLNNNTLVFDAHEHFTEVPEVTNRKITKTIWHLIGKIFVPKAKLCYTVGPQLAKLLGTIYKNKFKVIMNVPVLVDAVERVDKVDAVNEVDGENPGYILYQGALNKSRGLEQGILAMHQVENIKLLIAGEGDLSSELRELVVKEKLENKVQFLGFVQPADLKQLTVNAKVGLNLLEPNGLSYYYSLANKFFDYMQAGVPCVCANFPEYKAINEKYHCSVLIDCEVNEIANSINELLSNQITYQTLSKNCILASQNFNWAIEDAKLLNFYKQIL